jgi:PAS domain S-box-containing protein
MSECLYRLKILLVEDAEFDAFLIEHDLTKGGISFRMTRVSSKYELQKALMLGGWDIVITDYKLPDIDGFLVVKMVQAITPEIPCIMVSGMVSEEYAVDAMRFGAKDFISKDNLSRLVPAIHREIISKEDYQAGKLASTHLLESETKLKAISRSAQDGIVMMNPKGRVSFWNPAATRIFGFSAEEAIGKDLYEMIAPGSDLKTFRNVFPIFVESGEGVRIGKTTQIVALTKDLREIHIEISISGEHFQDGWHGIAIVRDISHRIALEAERVMMELQLHQAQKMEAVGQLASGIAHEINTPVQYIGDNTIFLRDMCSELLVFLDSLQREFLHGSLSEPAQACLKSALDALDLKYLQEELPKAIQESLEGVSRVSKIVAAMKEFSHPSMGLKRLVNLNRAIESTVLVCRNEWKYLADLELELDQTLPMVPCITDEFNQVILNLVINAAHAIEAASEGLEKCKKGLIRIITRHHNQLVEVLVSDTGTGIPDNIRARIFDPFFTTKPIGKGSGQGLAIARSIIVDKHQGGIRVETEPGKGTTFILELPLDGDISAP